MEDGYFVSNRLLLRILLTLQSALILTLRSIYISIPLEYADIDLWMSVYNSFMQNLPNG